MASNWRSPIRRKAVGSNSQIPHQGITVTRGSTADAAHGLGISNAEENGDSFNASGQATHTSVNSLAADAFIFNGGKLSTEANIDDTLPSPSDVTTPLSLTESYNGAWTPAAATTPLTPASALFGQPQDVITTSIAMEVTKPDQSSELYTATETEVAVPQATAVAEACTLVSTADDGETPNGSTLKDRLKTATDAAFWKHAYAETKHFASGILSQTTESNKHYTILRHSPPMIMYRGGSTSVTISIFSSPSHPLPADRTLWLQRRGFSGDTGLKIRAMISADGDWVDVTPRHQTEASKLEEADERAWQRDLGRITEKEAKKGDKGHLVRETHVVRIPAAAEDGYFRLALCTGGGGVPDEEADADTDAEDADKELEDGPAEAMHEKVTSVADEVPPEADHFLPPVAAAHEDHSGAADDSANTKAMGKRKSMFQKLKGRSSAASADKGEPESKREAASMNDGLKSAFKKFRNKDGEKDTNVDKSEKSRLSHEEKAASQEGGPKKPSPAKEGNGEEVSTPAKTSKSILHRIKGLSEDKKKERRRVLCASPIFRLTSASADPSVFRGAGLASMPLELSVKVASMVGQAHVQTLIAPVTSITDRLQPGFVTQTVAQTAYDMSGLEDKVTARVKSDATATTAPETNDKSATDGNVLGAEDGPEAPFPIKFSGTLTPSTSDVTAETGLFAATLGGVPDHVVVQLKGCYLGWACIKPPKADGGGEDDSAGKTALLDWHGALILVGPDPHEGPSVAARPVVRVYMLHDFGTAQPSAGAKIKAIAMGLLRAKDRLPTDPEKAKMMLARDADTARASLARETWGATAALEALAATKSARSLTDKYVDARALIRRRTDSIPLHRLGIRGSNSELLDKLHGTGGFWVAR